MLDVNIALHEIVVAEGKWGRDAKISERSNSGDNGKC